MKRIHPGFWIALFFALLIALETGFFVLASAQPDDRLAPEGGERVGHVERAG